MKLSQMDFHYPENDQKWSDYITLEGYFEETAYLANVSQTELLALGIQRAV